MTASRVESAADRSRTKAVDLERWVADVLNRWPAVGLAVGIVRDGALDDFHGHGVADITSRTPITEDTGVRVASISKTITGVAVMELWEQGAIDLDAPANDVLRAFRLVATDPSWRPATIRDLLTHTAGLPETAVSRRALMPDFGESVKLGQPIPTLAEYYGGNLRLVAEPGTRFRYGNHSFATLGQIVEDVSGEPLHRYLREHIFEPLGMDDTDLLRTPAVESRLATGYEMSRRGPKEVEPRQMVTAGAASVYSTPRDMARYVAAMLGGGSNEHGSVLKPETVAMMFAPQYQPDPLIAGMGLAFFRADLGGRPAVEHQGTLPGFHSQLFLSPDDGVGVIAFTNGSWRPDFWLPYEVSGLLRRVLGIPEDPIRTDVPRRPETWPDLCGWYRVSGPFTDLRVRAMAGAGAEVLVRGGQLILRMLTPVPTFYRGFPLLPEDPEDPYVFRVDLAEHGLGSMRVVFRQDEGRTTRMHLEVMPMTLHKGPDATNPRRWATGAAVGVAALAAGRRVVRARGSGG
ncbi:MAG: serine hydrolase domain-containing protein [Planctomycetaceae bacterium]